MDHTLTDGRGAPLGKLILSVCCLLVVAFQPEWCVAGVRVSPTYLIIASPSRSGAFNVTNVSDRDQEVWVEFQFGYQSINEKGDLYVVSAAADSGSDRSAARWLRAYPSRFLLPQNTTQTIRLLVSPPAGVADGEYWARAIISSKVSRPKVSATGTAPKELKGTIEIVEHADLPLHYRTGRTHTGLTIRGVNTSTKKDTLKVSVDLLRTGNTSFWGTATCRIKDNNGKTLSTIKKGVTIYRDEVVPLFLGLGSIGAGTYTLEVNFTSEGRGIKSDDLLKIDPVRYSTTISLP